MKRRSWRRAGLHRTILVNVIFLLAAALIFAGFLLLKISEDELVDQHAAQIRSIAETTGSALAVLSGEGNWQQGKIAGDLLKPGTGMAPVTEWGLFDHDLHTVGNFNHESLVMPDLALARTAGETVLRIDRPAGHDDDSVLATVPILQNGDFRGALQARFSLAKIRSGFDAVRTLLLIYLVLYGSILGVFGCWLLNRSVVQPIRRLQESAGQVAAGNLNQGIAEEGPMEITGLSRAFNEMLAALTASREETESHIASLRQANEDLRATRDELIRSEKMASIGHLAAGMAHEIGNPLGALIGYLGFLRAELPSGGQRDIAGRSLVEAERIDRLVRDLLDYAAPGGNDASFDPAVALREAAEILGHQGALAERMVVDRLPPSLPAVQMDRQKFLQVGVNLLLNARDAGKEGELIRLAGGTVSGSIWLSVADNGSGIEAAVLPQIFDPFFTTKPPGKGRGLGLFVCHRIIEDAGGRIEIRSVQGEGSTFTLWLNPAEATDGP